MRDGQVILFRHHGEFLLGRYVEGPRGKLQVSPEPGHVVRINPQQVVLEMEAVVGAEAFSAWREQCEALVQSMDLEEVWGVVWEERQHLSLDELASIVAAVSIPVQAVGGLSIEEAISMPQHGAPLVVIGAPLVIDKDAFKASDSHAALEAVLREVVTGVKGGSTAPE